MLKTGYFITFGSFNSFDVFGWKCVFHLQLTQTHFNGITQKKVTNQKMKKKIAFEVNVQRSWFQMLNIIT